MKRILLLLWALAALLAGPARADTNMGLYKSFTGTVNFAGTQVTLRDRSSGASACKVSAESTAQSATLTLPSGYAVVSAQLYWAGSGSADATVTMNSKSVTAPSSRIYTSATIGGGLNYFSAAADVTDLVKLKGGGTYTFSGLRVSSGSPWCERSAVLGGFALVVVYSQKDETYRTLNLYEGFRAMLNSEVRLDMANFRVPDNVQSTSVGRFGHIVWEGDSDLAQQGESLTFYNYTLTQSTYGPSGNNFNSKSSINSDTNSLGIDFDAYSMTGWPARLNAVSAVFKTGGDMVLLNAALLAVPSTPAADLSVDLVRTTELRPGALATYTATVTNNGPGVETGPFKVTLTLPAGLSYNSFSGANWSCTGSGTTATCTYTGALANGAKTALTLKATVASNATGSKTTGVTVVGNNDPAAGNDSSSETGTVVAATGTSYVYTTRECNVGEIVSTDAGCPLFDGPVVAGATPKIFVTAVDANNKARAVNNTVNLNVAMGCVNPPGPGTVQPTASGYKLPACVADTSVPNSATTDTKIWTAFPVTFPTNKASVGYDFQYLDAGSVKLYLSTNGTAATSTRSSTQFVSMPSSLRLTVKNAEGQLNPGAVGLAGNGFVRAGENFTIQAEAMSAGANPVPLPSFGKETGNGRPTLVNTVVNRLDAIASGADREEPTQLEGDFPSSGAFTGTQFSWSDVGSFSLKTSLDDYLGEKPNAFGSQNVGRVYPASYKTEAGPGFDCLPHMNCPSVGLAAISDAVYSQQPFNATIIALDENGKELPNFDSARYPSLVPKLTLAAVDAPGTGVSFGTRYTPGFVDTAAAATTRAVQFGLGAQFGADAAKTAWAGPTAVYLRATSDDVRMGTKVVTTSVQDDVGESEEGGIMVVNGRLAIDNVIGSELLKTPVPMRAQYWNGKNWENNTSFSTDTLLKTEQAVFSACTNRLQTTNSAGARVCDTAAVKAAGAGAFAVGAGVGKYLLAPTGAGRVGSVRIRMNTPAWLPSMYGQITIGAYKSPVIYIREVY
ncbi:DUF6701 domain-containing protein [uncultured Massilia sp.]|uniref:DUF6701 domain-containing protein n=1 Tax=uncultured Massilia sp. TaxID=169973 RepID=UPI002588297A|nr:DUF6701 domain-containing protein [uncultured Massilia sp.]